MKALVTGAAGQVGKALLANMPEGWSAVGLTRDDCDISDKAALAGMIASHAPDLLINAAAYTAVDKAESEPDLAFAINRDAVGVMADAMNDIGGRLVHISTDFVFDGRSSKPYLTGDKPFPLSVYGQSKLGGELAAGHDAVICRTSWVYAAGGQNFVRTMLRLMAERDELGVVSDQIGAPTYAGELAETLWALALRNEPGVFHNADAGAASWYDFAVAIQEEALEAGLLDRAIPIQPIATSDYPTPAARPAFSLLDCRETRFATGIEPTHWRVNLRKMLKEELALG